MSKLHKNKGFKHYSFSGMYPVEKDYVYKGDEIYNILIRSYNKTIIDEIQKCMVNLKNKDFVITNVEKREWVNKKIDFVDSLTPTVGILKRNNKPCNWNIMKDDKMLLENQLYNNIIKKYNVLNDTNIMSKYQDIIKMIQIKNNCPIYIQYKGTSVMGYKIRIYFQDNEIAQNIANLASVEGIGSKNSSLGMGFVKSYFI
jgi:CRISPR-associated endoribonuclease Cas6